MKYRKKTPLIEATQWFEDGDHSDVASYQSLEEEAFQSPDILPENRFCPECGNVMQKHGLLDGENGREFVCPSDYIVTNRRGLYYRLSRGEFESQYELYAPPPRRPTKIPVSDIEKRLQQRRSRSE